jgi:hypothetical protein
MAVRSSISIQLVGTGKIHNFKYKKTLLLIRKINFETNILQNDPEPLSVHVLDNEFGGNAANMTCRLYKLLNEKEFVFVSTQ